MTPLLQELLTDLYEEFQELDQRIKHYEKRLSQLCQQHELAQRLLSIPGVGPLTATLLLAVIGDASYFQNGRHFAAYLGLVPKQLPVVVKHSCWVLASEDIVIYRLY